MIEKFSYKRLEVISILYRSWKEIDTKLRVKSGSIDVYSFCFLCMKNTSKPKSNNINNSMFGIYKGGFFVSTPNNIWKYFNRANRNKRDNMYEAALVLKKKLIQRLKDVHLKFYQTDICILSGNDNKEQKVPYKSHDMLIYTIPAISTIAAILEGTLREILARYLQNEINHYVEEGNRTGRDKHNNYQKLLVAKQSKIESGSSFSSLLSEYSVLFELKISELISKEIIIIIESLFTLRNIFAHGTSIVTTSKPVSDDEYFKNWNKRVENLQNVLKKYFGSDNVYLNLSDIRISDFYIAYTSLYLMKIINFIKNYDKSAKESIESIGFINTLSSDIRNLTCKYDEFYLKMF